MIAGIDSGSSGTLVLLDGGQPVQWQLMPILKVGQSTYVNCAALAAFLRPYARVHVCLDAFDRNFGKTTE